MRQDSAEPVTVLTRAVPGSEKYLARVSALLFVLALGAVTAFCFFASSICITVVLAAFLSVLIDPIVTAMEHMRIPRPLGAAVLLFAGMSAMAYGSYRLYGEASKLAEVLPTYAGDIREALAPLNRKIEKVKQTAGTLSDDGAPVKKVPEVQVKENTSWPSYLIRGVGSVWGAIIIAGVVPFLMFFLLTRKEHMYARMTAVMGRRIDVPRFLNQVGRMVRGYVVGSAIIGSMMSVFTVFMLIGMHIHGAIPIGIASGFSNLIPFLGLLVAIALPVVAALLQYSGAATYVVIVLSILFLHFISTNLLVPRFVATRVSIGPVAATVGMLFWGWLWGVMGLLLAVPLTALVKLVADSHPAMHYVSDILAVNPKPVSRWMQFGETKIRGAVPYLRQRWQGARTAPNR
ncbi:MAG TPA: AI-2E family transporter [Candidatus Acidoferrales bacterium]|nr:AI-2E family transporter [Candidatus Acidoferrales bacterium]